MRRREFAKLIVATVSWPLAAHAQQKRMPVIGFLFTISKPPLPDPVLAAFHNGLGETGYVENQNVAIEYRWADGHYDRLPGLAADLVDRKVDVIVSPGQIATLAAKKATSTIPILFTGVGDPVGLGLVASLAQPGGNLTGFSNFANDLTSKRFQLLSELVPQAHLIALLVNWDQRSTERTIHDVQEAARVQGVQVLILKAATESEIDAAFAAIVEMHAGALYVSGDPFFFSRREQFMTLASRHAVPAIYLWRDFAVAGGLISYGTKIRENFRNAGNYAGRILKGTKPADLPVQQPTILELVINLKAAKALGLTVPLSLLARADEVIE